MSEKLTVKDSPVGLFKLDCGEIICISEYASKTHNGNYSRDAYIVSSGENYCGGDNKTGKFLDIKELTEAVKDMREALGLVLKKNQIKSTYFAGMPYPSKHERIHDGRYAKTARECLEKWKDL